MYADDWELCHENDIAQAYRRLFLAVVAQAVKDAANGDLVAVAFVNEWGLTHCLAHVKRRKRRKVAA